MYLAKFSLFVLITLSSHFSPVCPIKYNVVQKLSAFRGDELILEEETKNVESAKTVSPEPEKGYKKVFNNLWPFEDIKHAQEELSTDMKNEIDKENEISNDLNDEDSTAENWRNRRDMIADLQKQDGKHDKEFVYSKIKASILDGLKNGLKRIHDGFYQFFG